ncbi:Mak10-domain-containing protein [Cryphonectria parasitica EP155]|uniref:Mak10-domain-containing protein n=1 Tax=Cryphonectria parasitica (strain ATCC 38755 / EP155) TaxID=660469 RepID=A0A9P5CQN3_CRYP1|nr:Mak10-domain-containing protein [Cryphonectria parasitica EP155]KAF3766401.1 Mak10-domain-containing protein [Cryphonectria parasitica EP155]
MDEFNVTSALEPGELVKDGFFTLFESVGALEIMDPKMDSGCLAPGEPLEEKLQVDVPLMPEEVLGIMDQLLCHEMAWHLGYPLSQTLFTSIHLESIMMPPPNSLEDAYFTRVEGDHAHTDRMLRILRAYCLGLLKACRCVNERIKFEHYYEEEDFVTNTYHRSLLDNVPGKEVFDEIRDARDLLHSMSRELGAEMTQALDFRLELRYAFLRAIELSELRTHPESLKTPWVEMKAILDPISQSHPLGTPCPRFFSAKLQRRLASTMPPRPIVQLSFEEAISHFRRLAVDGLEVADVLKYTDSQSLLNFILTFQAKKPQPLVYIRTLLQNYVFKDMVLLGSLSIRQVFDDDLALIVLPSSRLLDRANDNVEAVNDPRYAIAHQMEVFRQRAAQSYLDVFRAFCQNRCRVRRTLCHAIQDWEAVQADAEEIDQLLQLALDEKPLSYQPFGTGSARPTFSLPLSSWAYLYKLRLMVWIVQLGFELEVYQPDELAGMYWYLSYLARIQAGHVERIKAFAVRTLNELRARSAAVTAAREQQVTRSLSYLRATLLEAAVTWELADALSSIYTLLYDRLGLVSPPPRPYSTDELRYEIRMRPFIPIELPELPTYTEFSRSVRQEEKPATALLSTAESAVAGAKKGYEVLMKFGEKEAFTAQCHKRWMQATRAGFKSAIQAGLAVSTLKRVVEARDKGQDVQVNVKIPGPHGGYHEWWVVPTITITTAPKGPEEIEGTLHPVVSRKEAE